MSDQKSFGPAFPESRLRDLFAGLAAASITGSRHAALSNQNPQLRTESLKTIAADAYAIADALLAERGEPAPQPYAGPVTTARSRIAGKTGGY